MPLLFIFVTILCGFYLRVGFNQSGFKSRVGFAIFYYNNQQSCKNLSYKKVLNLLKGGFSPEKFYNFLMAITSTEWKKRYPRDCLEIAGLSGKITSETTYIIKFARCRSSFIKHSVYLKSNIYYRCKAGNFDCILFLQLLNKGVSMFILLSFGAVSVL